MSSMALGSATAEFQLKVDSFLDGARKATSALTDLQNASDETTFNQAEASAQSLESRLESLNKKAKAVGDSIASVGRKMTAFATTPIMGFLGASVQQASDLNEEMNKNKEVFDDYAGAMIAWSQDANTALGMSQEEALRTTATFGNMYTAMGMNQEQAAGMSREMVQLASDFASFHNVNSGDASRAFQAALTGEYESLKRYGIVMNQAMVEARALEMGLADVNGEFETQDLVLARQSIIMEQAGNAQGDFERTSTGLANTQRILGATIADISAQLGAVLLPIVTAGAQKLLSFLEAVRGLDEGKRRWVVGIMLAVAAIGPLLIGIGTLIPLLTTGATILFGLLSPIGLVAAALVALGLLFKDDIVNAVKSFVDKLGDLYDAFTLFRENGLSPVQAALAALQNVFPRLRDVIMPVREAVDALGKAFEALRDGNFADMFGHIWDAVVNIGEALGNLAVDLIGWTLSVGAPRLVGWIVDIAGDVWGGLKSLAGWTWDNRANLGDITVSIGRWVNGGIQNVWNWLVGLFTDNNTGGTGLAGDGTGGASYGGGSIAFTSVMVNVGRWAKGKIADVWAWLQGLVDGGVSWGGGFGESNGLGNQHTSFGRSVTMRDVFIDIGGWLKGKWPDIKAFFDTHITQPVRHAIDLALDVDNLSLGGIKDFEDAVAGIKNDWQRMKQFASWFTDSFQLPGNITDFQSVVEGIKNDWQNARKFATWFMDEFTLGMGIQDWNDVVEGLKNDWQAIKDAASWLMNDFSVADLPGMTSFSEMMQGIRNDIETIQSIWNAITGAESQTNSAGGLAGTGEPNPNGAGYNQFGQYWSNYTSGGSWYTPYSDPYNPTLGGKGIDGPNDAGLWIEAAEAVRDFASEIAIASENVTDLDGAFVPLSTSIDTSKTKFSEFDTALSTSSTLLVEFVAGTAPLLAGFANAVEANVNRASDTLKNRTSGATSASKSSYITFVGDTVAVMGGWSGGIQTIVNTTSDALKNRTSGATSSAKSSFITFVGDTIAVMGGWSTGIQNQINTAADTLKNRASGATSSAKSSFALMASGIRGSMAEATAAVGASANGWAGIIERAGGGMYASGLYAGSMAGAGVAQGLLNMLSTVQIAANTIISTVNEAMLSAGRITSPSKLTMYIGEMLGLGVNKGLEKLRPLVERTAASLISFPDPSRNTYRPTNVPSYGGQVTYISYGPTVYALKSEELQELIQNAETGAEYATARSQPNATTRYLRRA